jgi:uncharacterized protein DUF6893
MKRTIALLATAGALIAAVVAQLPELRRYLKIRAM